MRCVWEWKLPATRPGWTWLGRDSVARSYAVVRSPSIYLPCVCRPRAARETSRIRVGGVDRSDGSPKIISVWQGWLVGLST